MSHTYRYYPLFFYQEVTMTDLYTFLSNCTTPVRADTITKWFELLESLEEDWSTSALDDFFETQAQNMSYGEIPNAIESIAYEALNDALKNRHIYTKTDAQTRYTVLDALFKLEDYFNSAEVISFKDEELTDELILSRLLSIVSNQSVDYYLEAIVMVRPQVMIDLFDLHEKRFNATQSNFVDTQTTSDRLEYIQRLKDKIEDGMGFDLILFNEYPIGIRLDVLVDTVVGNAYPAVENAANDILSLVAISQVSKSRIKDKAIALANQWYGSNLDTVSYVVNQINHKLVGVDNE
jgi:hypothetical protein